MVRLVNDNSIAALTVNFDFELALHTSSFGMEKEQLCFCFRTFHVHLLRRDLPSQFPEANDPVSGHFKTDMCPDVDKKLCKGGEPPRPI